MGKCQDVDVSFLKKSAQEEEAAAQKQEAAVRDYLALQAQAREEPVTLSYVFRSENTQRELPSGVHRATVTVKMGDAAEEVERVWKELENYLRSVHVKASEKQGFKKNEIHKAKVLAQKKVIWPENGKKKYPTSVVFVLTDGMPNDVEATAMMAEKVKQQARLVSG